jgi:hypothetical protein
MFELEGGTMSIRIDPFADYIRGVLIRNHRRVGDRHTDEWFNFEGAGLRFTPHFCQDFAAEIPEAWRDTTEFLVAPGFVGGELATGLGAILGIPVVRLFNRAQNCDPIDQKQASEMKGKRCLLIDVCVETRATIAGAAATILQYRGSIIGALAIMDIKSNTNGRGPVRLPLGFEVKSCISRSISYYTSDQCPVCKRR